MTPSGGDRHLDESDQDWVTQAVLRYQGPLILYAQRILGEAELARARDVVQDTFLKLCRASREQVDGHLAAWLYMVCRRAALDIRRKERRMTLITDDTAASFSAADAGPALLIEQAESAENVMRSVRQLPENQREVVVLKFAHNLSYKEIAQVTGHSVGNVGFLLHTALKALRQHPSLAE